MRNFIKTCMHCGGNIPEKYLGKHFFDTPKCAREYKKQALQSGAPKSPRDMAASHLMQELYSEFLDAGREPTYEEWEEVKKAAEIMKALHTDAEKRRRKYQAEHPWEDFPE
jgi:hypothetical protein